MSVRRLEPRDLDAVVQRVHDRLAVDARRNPLLNPEFSPREFSDALAGARKQTWVYDDLGRITGHLYGALLENFEYVKGVWIGPDGVSFESLEVLKQLYGEAAARWKELDARDHYVWVFDSSEDTAPWYEMGFTRMHQRGVLALDQARAPTWPSGYQLRRGGVDDLALAVELDRKLDQAQLPGPSLARFIDHASPSAEMLELLGDEQVHYYVVQYQGRGVAQCFTYPLDTRRGTFDQTLHVSGVVVRPEHEHRGVARALIDAALTNALHSGFRYAEANWRVANRRAAKFWTRYGFRATYVRLHRTTGRN